MNEGLCDIINALTNGFPDEVNVNLVGFMVPGHTPGDVLQPRLTEFVGACNQATEDAVATDLNGFGQGVNITSSIADPDFGCPGGIIDENLPLFEGNWGPGLAVVAAEFVNWTPGNLRVVVPIIAQSPCFGGYVCSQADADVLDAAIGDAIDNDVLVSPLMVSQGADCVQSLLIESGVPVIGTYEEYPGQTLADMIFSLGLDEECDTCVERPPAN